MWKGEIRVCRWFWSFQFSPRPCSFVHVHVQPRLVFTAKQRQNKNTKKDAVWLQHDVHALSFDIVAKWWWTCRGTPLHLSAMMQNVTTQMTLLLPRDVKLRGAALIPVHVASPDRARLKKSNWKQTAQLSHALFALNCYFWWLLALTSALFWSFILLLRREGGRPCVFI